MAKSTTLSIYIAPDLKKKLQKLAEKESRTLSGQVVYILSGAVK